MGSKLNYQKKRNNRRIYSNLKIVGYLKKLKANRIIIYDDQSKKVFFCTCKQTNDQPLCDGSHNIK